LIEHQCLTSPPTQYRLSGLHPVGTCLFCNNSHIPGSNVFRFSAWTRKQRSTNHKVGGILTILSDWVLGSLYGDFENDVNGWPSSLLLIVLESWS